MMISHKKDELLCCMFTQERLPVKITQNIEFQMLSCPPIRFYLHFYLENWNNIRIFATERRRIGFYLLPFESMIKQAI